MNILIAFAVALSFVCFSRSTISERNAEVSIVPIPLVTVSLNIDPNNYVARMIRSIDYPISKFIVQVGNVDARFIKSVKKSIDDVFRNHTSSIQSFEFVTQNYNPGSAQGFNLGNTLKKKIFFVTIA
jgi:hypothetical protein